MYPRVVMHLPSEDLTVVRILDQRTYWEHSEGLATREGSGTFPSGHG